MNKCLKYLIHTFTLCCINYSAIANVSTQTFNTSTSNTATSNTGTSNTKTINTQSDTTYIPDTSTNTRTVVPVTNQASSTPVEQGNAIESKTLHDNASTPNKGVTKSEASATTNKTVESH